MRGRGTTKSPYDRGSTPRLPRAARRAARAAALVAVCALVGAGLAVAGPQSQASADSAPADPADPTTATTVAADALPTAQINGVAWSQVIVAGMVYVAGQFSTARPAGAAAGTSSVARSNLLAYDLATGALVGSWAPALNGPAYVIAASTDGTRLYVGGDFTTVNGAAQSRFVVLNRATGQRVTGFSPNPNAAVRAIAATSAAIYFGGNFSTVAGNSRARLAAISASTGALLAWKASAQSAQVEAMVLSPDNSRLIVGGRFASLNGVAALGSGALSAATGATLPWAANTVVTNYGYDAGITSLSSDGNLIYGTGFAFLGRNGGYGNLEGTFAANPTTGAVVWVEDCHGDTYSVYANPGKPAVYVVGHPHFCSNMGGFGATSWKFALAFSKADVTTITPNTVANYYDWQGVRAPALLAFSPEFTGGTFTGTNQAAWNVTGSGDYVVYGGEFFTVNGQGQQGLVRMALSGRSTNKQGPRLTGAALNPAATSKAAGTAQVSWPTNWDRDNETLTYAVLRDNGATPVYTTTARSTWWRLPRLSFTDTGLANGSTHSYKVRATDPFGNFVTSGSVSVTVAGASAGPMSAYAREILLGGPSGYWRLGESSGAAQDWTGLANSAYGAAVGRAVTGAIPSDPTNRAARFTGTSTSRVYGSRAEAGSNQFSVEAWFKTTSTGGGKLVGFGNSSTGNSGNNDRHVYMSANGGLNFGVYPNTPIAISSASSYNDGQWHHVVATLGPTGMRLYVDGGLRAERSTTTTAGVYTGYWRIGGDTLASNWPAAGGPNWVGDIDDVAVYGRALTPGEVASHYSTGTGGTAVVNQPPVSSFTSTTSNLTVAVDGAGSTDVDGAVARYSWNFGDGGSATGVTASHAFAGYGTYRVTLTVTDDRGASTAVSRDVSVAAPTTLVVASDAFARTAASGFGPADVGGAWESTAGATSVAGGAGRLTLAGASSTATARLPGVSGNRLLTQVTESWDKRPSGSGGWFLLRGRITSTGEEYRLKLGHKSTGAVTARLARTTSSGAETALTSELTVPGLTYAAGTRIVAQFEVTGTSPSTLRAKVWAEGATPPSAWLIVATDTTAALQASGHTGFAALTSSTTTNGPVVTQVDDYTVRAVS